MVATFTSRDNAFGDWDNTHKSFLEVAGLDHVEIPFNLKNELIVGLNDDLEHIINFNSLTNAQFLLVYSSQPITVKLSDKGQPSGLEAVGQICDPLLIVSNLSGVADSYTKLALTRTPGVETYVLIAAYQDGVGAAGTSPTPLETWKVYYTDGTGTLTPLALGLAGTLLQSAGPAAAPIFAALQLDNLSDVQISSPITNNILQYDGSNWVNNPAQLLGTTNNVEFNEAKLANLTAARVVVSGVSKTLASSAITAAELNSLSGITVNIQSELNAKEPTLTKGNLTESTSSILTVTGGTGAVIGAGTSITVTKSDSTHDGYLSKEDWNTFNSGGIPSHNSLSGLQGGTSAEYYHLTNVQHTTATQAASSSVPGYLTSADWSTFNGKQAALGFTPANDSSVIHNTGNETVAGIKTLSSAPVLSSLTASEIMATTAGSATTTLPVATYPSLAELAYVKGTTSAVQTQLNTLTTTTSGKVPFHGFVDRSLSSISISGLTFTLTKISNYTVYINGVLLTITANKTVDIGDTSGLHYIAMLPDGSLTVLAGQWDIRSFSAIPVAIIWRIAGVASRVWDERHGYNRNLEWHYAQHIGIGSRYISGLAGTFTTSTISVLSGEIIDEDISNTTSGTATVITHVYRATGGVNELYDATPSTTVIKTNGTNPVYDSNGTLTPVDNNNYCNYFVYMTNDATSKTINTSNTQLYCVLGQGQYSNVTNAQSAPLPTFNSGFTTAEIKLLYRVICRRTTGSPAGAYIQADDLRAVSSGPAISGSAGTVTAATVSFVPVTGITATDVQTAIEQLNTSKLAAVTVDGTTITGAGTPASPLVAVGGATGGVGFDALFLLGGM